MPVDTRAVTAEAVGTAFLLIAVVGSGIAAEDLSTDVGLQLLENALATWGALTALILAFAAVSGAHFNPVVTLTERVYGTIDSATAGAYIVAQFIGAICGVIIANLMFDLDAITWSTKDRTGANIWLSEVVATIGLLLIIFLMVRRGRGAHVGFAVGAWIGGAYWFTSSTSFANPAVSVARAFSDTFAGISPSSVPGFIVAQLIGLVLAIGLLRWLVPDREPQLP